MTSFDLPPDLLDRTQDPEQAPQAPPPRPGRLDSILDEMVQQGQQRLRTSFSLATQADPDVAGEAQRLGKLFDLDSLVGERNIEELRRKHQDSKLAQMGPGVRRALLDHEFARVAHDDLDNLSTLEDIWNKIVETPAEFISLSRAITGFASQRDWERVAAITGRHAQEELTVELGALGSRVILQGFTPEDQREMDRIDRQRRLLPSTSPGFLSALSGILGQMKATIPVIAGTAAGGAGVGFLVGGPAGAVAGGGAAGTGAIFSTSAMIEGGNMTLDLIREGVDPDVAREIGALGGTINGLLEVVGFEFLSAPARKVIREKLTKATLEGLTRATTGAAVARAAGAYGLGLGGEVGTEVAQELVNVLGELEAGVGPESSDEVWDRIGGIIAETVAGTAFLAGIGPAVQLADNIQRAERAKVSVGQIEELLDTTAKGKVPGRNPTAFAAFLQTGLEGTPGENLYFAPERLQEALDATGIDRAQLRQQLPDFDQRLTSALETGSDVVIPTADYAALVAGTPLDEQLRPHMRLDPDNPSLQEVQEFLQGPAGEKARSDAQRIVSETVQREEAFERSADVVESDILAQLTETGILARKQAQAVAVLHRAFTSTQARRTGKTPQQVQAESPLLIQRGKAAERLMPGLEQRRQPEQGQPPEEGERRTGPADRRTEQIPPPFGERRIAEEPRRLPSPRRQMIQEGGDFGIEQAVPQERRQEDAGPPEGQPERRAAPSPLAQMIQEGGSLGVEGEGIEEFVDRATRPGAPRSLEEAEQQQAEARIEGRDEPLLQRGEGDPRAAFDPVKLTATLFEKADVSSVLHELAHYYLTVLTQIAASQPGPTQVRADVETFLRSAGVESIEAWLSMTLSQKRKAHETFALSFEDYLYTGEAPSADLERVFQSFRRWLRRIYRAVRDKLNAIFKRDFGENLPVLQKELRGIFDRMLATEDAILQQEAIRSYGPLFRTQEEMGASAEEWANYVQALSDAHEAAITDLDKASMRQMQWLSGARSKVLKALQAEHDDLRKDIHKEEAERVRRLPVYRAQHFLRRGEFISDLGEVEPGPDQHRLETEAARALLPKGSTLRDLSGMTNREGLPPDVVAEMFGFSSGQNLVNQLISAPPQAQLVDEVTDDRLLTENGDLLDPQVMEGEVQRALHNDARARFLAVEWKHLSSSTMPQRLIGAAAKRAARSTLASTPVRDIRHRTYVAGEARARKEAMEAARAGDPVLARRKKQEELLQHHLAGEALKVEQEIAKVVDRSSGRLQGKYRRLLRADEKIAKTRNVDLVGAARAILAAHDLAPGETQAAPHLSRVREYDPALADGLETIVLEATTTAGPWREMTLDEFRMMVDAVDALDFQSRRDKVIQVEGKRVEVEQIVNQLLATLAAPDAPRRQTTLAPTERWKLGFGSLKSWFRHVESWAIEQDGGTPGTVHRHLFALLREPFDDYVQEKLDLVKQTSDRLNKLDFGSRQKIDAPELEFTFRNKADMLGAVRHAGNESNLRKLLLGYGMVPEPETPTGPIDTSAWWAFFRRMIDEGVITKQDMDYVQALWDVYEGLLPRSQKAFKDVYGYRFETLDAEPIQTPWGIYRGGYVPAKIDPQHPETAADPIRETDPLMAAAREFQQSMPTTGRGFTFARVEFNRPLRLDITLDAQLLDEHLRFIHLQRPGRDILRLLRDRRLARAIAANDPSASRDMFVPWLQDTLHNRVLSPGGPAWFNAGLTILRRNTGMAIMFANVSVGLQQITGLATSMLHVDRSFLRGSASKYLRTLFTGQMRARATRLSKFMDIRLGTVMGQIRDDLDPVLLKPGWLRDLKQWTLNNGFFLQRWLQTPVDLITWDARYEQSLADGRTETQAIRDADAAVRRSQASGTAADLSRIERGHPLVRLLFQFSTFWNAQLNTILSRRGWRRALAFLNIVGFAGLTAGAIAQALRGGWDDEDDDGALWDDVTEWTIAEAFQTTGAVLAPAIAPAILPAITGEFGGRITFGAGLSTLASALRPLRTGWNEMTDPAHELSGQDLKDIGTALSLVLGIPVTGLSSRIGVALDQQSGEIEPTSELDRIRGLITGRPSEASRR